MSPRRRNVHPVSRTRRSAACRLSPTALPLLAIAAACGSAPSGGVAVDVTVAESMADEALDGRLILILSQRDEGEPRFHVSDGIAAQPAFGLDVDGWVPGTPVTFTDTVFGWPVESLGQLPPGRYRAQALLNRYETFTRSDGHTIKLPPDRGEGQQWQSKPGNLYSAVTDLAVDERGEGTVALTLDRVIPELPDPESLETEWVRHVRIRSELLSDFWGTDMYLGAWVLLPDGFDEHPEARYPLAIFHGHFPATFSALRVEPPDTTEECVYSARFDLDCYNRIQQEYQHELYRAWTSPGFPRHLVAEIQHPTPYYDDSYAVNSENNGPYGDAIMTELVPAIEREFRGIGEGWARVTYGGSTGGWEAMAAQVFYPDDFNGAYIACPDPIDFRQFTLVNLYEEANAYYMEGPFERVARPGRRNYLGHVDRTLEGSNHLELVLGTKTRSGQQYDIWEAVYSPVGDDGYPRRIWDKVTGEIDPEVAEHWRENYDLTHILRRDWATLGPKLRGKLHIYVGEMDNYYLNNAVYLAEEFLEGTSDPYYAGEVAYGARDEHCWNGDPTRPNAISRLRYVQMFAPRMMERILASHPPGADLTSWRY